MSGAIAVIAIGLSASAAGSAHDDGRDSVGPLDLRRLSVKQHRSTLHLQIQAAQQWSPRALEARPAIAAGEAENYLCVELRQRDEHSRWCVARGASGKMRLIGGPTNDTGELLRARRLRGAHVHHHGTHRLSATFRYGAAGLEVGRYGWRGLSGWSEGPCAPAPVPKGDKTRRPARRKELDPAACRDQAPDQGYFGGKIVKPHVVGCTRDEDMFNTVGSSKGRRVALTFDDGPSAYTSHVLRILNRRHVHSTFFEIGENTPGHADVMRRIIASGDEIGNHSLHHETGGASAASLRETSARIRKATGFTPCLYRPPGGYVSAATSRAAWHQGMSNILWDVDTNDWQGPGSATIYSRVVNAVHSGSIVLMHDGGGNRSATVGALDHIIGTLKARGYHLVTVTSLLGEHFRWRP